MCGATITELKKAVAYHRVSPTLHKKGESGLHSSLEESIRICHQDAKHDGYEIVHDYIDEYVSGKSTKHMIDFNNMLTAVSYTHLTLPTTPYV